VAEWLGDVEGRAARSASLRRWRRSVGLGGGGRVASMMGRPDGLPGRRGNLTRVAGRRWALRQGRENDRRDNDAWRENGVVR
jgi:hypothetical protein